jgi:hypothetical protein
MNRYRMLEFLEELLLLLHKCEELKGNSSKQKLHDEIRKLIVLGTRLDDVDSELRSLLKVLEKLAHVASRDVIGGGNPRRDNQTFLRLVQDLNQKSISLYGHHMPVLRDVVDISTGFSAYTVPVERAENIRDPQSREPRKPKPVELASPITPTPSALKFETRHLTANSPSIVGLNKKFIISACIDIQPFDDMSVQLAPLAIPEDGLQITLLAIDEPNNRLELLSKNNVLVVVMPGIRSKEVKFEFKALARGSAKVTMRAFMAQTYLGELDISIEVSEANAGTSQKMMAQVYPKKNPESDATLEVEYLREQETYRFCLRGGGRIGTHKYEQNHVKDPVDFIKDTIGQLNALTTAKAKATLEGTEANLEGIGTELWKILPRRLTEKLIENWERIERLTILSENDLLPWELMYCAKQEAFVSDKWLIYRWCYGDAPPLELGNGPTRYVLPNKAPTTAVEEVSEIRKIYSSENVWGTLTELLAGFKDANMGLLHIAAHNCINYESPQATYLMLNEKFLPNMLGKYEEARMKNNPLVFLNACSSAASTEQWVGSASWAHRFLLAGAGAFVGSLWEIRDTSASKFALTFYENTRKGHALGESFRLARKSIATMGDPTRFAYTFFGDPDAVLSREQQDAS